MHRYTAISILIVAAMLEAGGDAIMRVALHSSSSAMRIGLFLLAAVVLFAYGWTVNAPPWDFGKLMGLYVVFFFVIGQIISWIFFKQTPSLSTIAASVLIVSGGVVYAAGNSGN
jgi:predicted membrane channel-forming protein YqfA (hemolysin III family)